MFKWIRISLGITELINQQEKTNKLLELVTLLQEHQIINDCKSFSHKTTVNRRLLI